MATGVMRGRGSGVRTRGGRGRNNNYAWKPNRFDNNIFTALREPEDTAQDGDGFDICENSMMDILHTNMKVSNEFDKDWISVRNKQTKRPRVSSSDQSNFTDFMDPIKDTGVGETGEYELLSNEDKLSLILSKLSINENRVKLIQNRLESVVHMKKRVSEVENVVKSHEERLKLLEYRSIDIEARSRRKNLLFKGLPENRNENCFEEVRRFISEKLNIDNDMYLERAHRLGRYAFNKTRPIIVAFRDFCDTELILNGSSNLRGTNFGVSRDYPNELSKARQSIWRQFKTTRDNNPHKKVTFGYPASIRVDGDIVVDLFPDWYSVLQGSRISITSNQPTQSDMTRDQNRTSSETGLTGQRSADHTTQINHASCDINTTAVISGARITCDQHILRPTTSSRETLDSDSETDGSEQLSQSLISKETHSSTNMAGKGPVPNANLENKTPVRERGRSITRRPQVVRRRSQSTWLKSRGSNIRNNSKGGKPHRMAETSNGRSKSTDTITENRGSVSMNKQSSTTNIDNDDPQNMNGSSGSNKNI